MEELAASRFELLDHAARVYALSGVERGCLETLLDVMLGDECPGRALTVGMLAKESGFDLGEVATACGKTGTLVTCALVTIEGSGPLLTRQIALHDELWPRLVGAPLTGVMRPPTSRPARLDALVLAPRVAEQAKVASAWLQKAHGRWPVLIVKGPAGTGRAALAAALAAELTCGVFPCDGSQLSQATLAVWRRELAWHQAVPVIADADGAEPSALGALAQLFPGPLMLTTVAPLAAAMLAANRAIHQLETEVLEMDLRRQVWEVGLSRAGAEPDTVDTAFLANRYRFGPGRISSVIAHLSAGDDPIDTTAAVALCRAVPDAHVGGLAARLPPASWDELVVPAAIKAELGLIETWGRGKAVFHESRSGLACLFHGRPGTGKTLAARALAGELGLDLYRVDLSQVIDKYIGESEKRLDRVLREAEAAGAILFFDEADALFAQRTMVREARDRYANIETSFLLQRLEDHAGLTILATNLQANLDSAFHRRLGIMVEFPPPEIAERRRLWEKFLPPLGARSAAIDVEFLARSVALPGGDIRNAVFGASLIAGSRGETLDMKHLAIGLWREMKKAGRLLDMSTLGPWQGAVLAYARATT